MAALEASQEASGLETGLLQQPLCSASRRAAAPLAPVCLTKPKSAFGRRIHVNGTTGALFTDSLRRRRRSAADTLAGDWWWEVEGSAAAERREPARGLCVCVSTVDYGESLWFHLFHIHEPNGSRCIIHEQIRR